MSDNHEIIRQRAYEIWQERGEPAGAHEEIWREAELEVLTAAADGAEIEDEGSHTGERASNQATTDSVRSKKVGEAAARAVAGTNDPDEAAENRAAEETGKGRSHGEDPLLKS